MLNIHENLIDTLNEAEIYLLMHITRYMGQHGFAFPSNETLCTRTRWHLNTLKKHKRSLTEKGLIRVEARFKDQGGQTSNAYFVETDEIGIYLGARAGQKLAGPQNLYRGEEQKIAHPVGQNLDRGEVQDLAPEVLSTLSIKNLSIKRGEDAPTHFADVRNKVSKGQPVIDFVPDSLLEEEITGPEPTKRKPSKKSAETLIADLYTREAYAMAWDWTPFAKAHPHIDGGVVYDKLEAWSSSKGEKKLDWLATGRVWVQKDKSGTEFIRKATETVAAQVKMAQAAGYQPTLKEIAAAQYIEYQERNAAKKGGPRP